MTAIRLVRLQDVCAQDRKSIKPGDCDNLRYVGLETIEANTGQFLNGELSKTPEVPKANSFRFGTRHVLYGKLRPYLNKVALPEFEGKCSTEIIPLLPKTELERAYLAYFLRSPHVVSQITEKTAGSRMPRADIDFVLGLHIPLPPLSEQRRIVDILSRAEGIVRLRCEAQKKATEIIPALFIDMFGDPATNLKGWPVKALGYFTTSGPQNGLYKHASFYGEGIPIVRIDAFYDGRFSSISNLKRVRITPDEQKKFKLLERDILVNRVNSPEYLGKSTIIPPLNEDTVFESNMMRFSINVEFILPEYLIEFLQTAHTKAHFLSKAKHAINQSSINQQDVKSLPVTIPPIERQTWFVERVEQIRSIHFQQATATAKAEATFNALLAGFFSTPLTERIAT